MQGEGRARAGRARQGADKGRQREPGAAVEASAELAADAHVEHGATEALDRHISGMSQISRRNPALTTHEPGGRGD